MASLETQKSLLIAATEVFSQKGFAGARVDEIARRAKANKAMIYYHFRSKEKLYEAVLAHIFGSFQEGLERVAKAEPDPRHRLIALYRALADFFAREPAYPRLIVREMLAGGRHMDPSTSRILGSVFMVIRDTIEAGIEQGTFRPVSPMVVHLNMLASLLIYVVSTPFRERVRANVPDVIAPAPTMEDVLAYLDAVLTHTVHRVPTGRLSGSQS